MTCNPLTLGVGLLGACLFGIANAEVAAPADGPSTAPRISAYVLSSTVAEAILPLAKDEDRRLGLMQDCMGDFRLHISGVTFLTAIEMPEGKSNPSRGDWLTKYEFTRCGETRLYNVIFSADPQGGVVKAKRWYPGRSNATPRLIQDAMPVAFGSLGAKATNKTCRRIEVFDMRIDEPPHAVTDGDGVSKQVLNETWTFDVCGQRIEAALTFIQKTDRGGFDIQAQAK